MDDSDSSVLSDPRPVLEAEMELADSEGQEQDEPFEPDHDVLGVYEQRMISLFPDFAERLSPSSAAATPEAAVLDHQDGSEDEASHKPMTKKEKQTAKRRRQRERQRIAEAEAEEEKRRKAEEERKVMEAEPILFRLYSSCPVMPVQIVRQPDVYPIPSNPLHLPLDEVTSSRIRRIAAESAVAGPSASALASYPPRPTKFDQRTFRLAVAGEPLPPYFIGEIYDPARVDPLPDVGDDRPSATAWDHSSKTLNSLNLIPADQGRPAASTKRRSRGRRRTIKDTYRPPPRFYAPPSGLGGKSRGYAWGWRDSQEGMREHEHGYLRS